jgi:hypothetical protein
VPVRVLNAAPHKDIAVTMVSMKHRGVAVGWGAMRAQGGVARGDRGTLAGRRDGDDGEERGMFEQIRLVAASIRIPGGHHVQLQRLRR